MSSTTESTTTSTTLVEVRDNLCGLAGTWGKHVKSDKKLSTRTSDEFKAGLDLLGKREDGKSYGLEGYFVALYSGDKSLLPEVITTILHSDKKDPDSDAGIVRNRWSVMLSTLQNPKDPNKGKGDELVTLMGNLDRLLKSDRRDEVITKLNLCLVDNNCMETDEVAE